MIKPYYQDDSVTIYNADYKDILPNLEQADHLITDPPFGAYTHKHAKSNRGSGHDSQAIDFAAIDFAAILELFETYAPKRWIVSFLDDLHAYHLRITEFKNLEYVRTGVWLKSNPMPQISADRPARGWDAIAYLHNKDTKKSWNGGGSHGNFYESVVTNGAHPTGKPEKILRKLVALFTNPGELIIDPFMGSGTTLVAAKYQNRKAIGVELSEKYCEVAAKRLTQESLFNFYDMNS